MYSIRQNILVDGILIKTDGGKIHHRTFVSN